MPMEKMGNYSVPSEIAVKIRALMDEAALWLPIGGGGSVLTRRNMLEVNSLLNTDWSLTHDENGARKPLPPVVEKLLTQEAV